MNGVYPVEVRFKDIDLAGHVHNSVYLSYFEQARISLFNEFVAKDWDWKTNGLILARNEVDYIHPVYLNDKVQVRVYCDHIGTKSFTLSYELFSENDQGERNVHTKGRSILVCMNYKKQETVAIYEGWSEVLQIL